MKDLKKDIKDNGLKMDMGLFDAEVFDPEGVFCDACTLGCEGGCFWSGAPSPPAEELR